MEFLFCGAGADGAVANAGGRKRQNFFVVKIDGVVILWGMKKFLSLLVSAYFCAACALASDSDGADFVACSGRIVPKDRVQKLAAGAGSGVQSVVKTLSAKAGDVLKAGDVVAVIDGEAAAAAAVARARAALATAESARDLKLAEHKNTVDELAGEAAQIENVLREKDPPRREREELEYQHTGILRRIAQARAITPILSRNQDCVVAEARTALAEAQRVHESYFLRTPIAGKVLETHVKAGEAVSMEGVCEIADVSEIFVEAEVYVADIAKVKVGAKAEISCDALKGATYAGRVVQISSTVKSNKVFSADPSDFSNLKVVRVKIALDNSGAFENLIGTQVSVRIFTK